MATVDAATLRDPAARLPPLECYVRGRCVAPAEGGAIPATHPATNQTLGSVTERE
jgi:hypothetical protein